MKRSDKFLSKGNRALLSLYIEDCPGKPAATIHTTPFPQETEFLRLYGPEPICFVNVLGVKGNPFLAKGTGNDGKKETGLNLPYKATSSLKFYFSFNCKRTVVEDSYSRTEFSR